MILIDSHERTHLPAARALAFLDYWNTFAKHDSAFQKSLLLSHLVSGRPGKPGGFANDVFQKWSNSRLMGKVPKIPLPGGRTSTDPFVVCATILTLNFGAQRDRWLTANSRGLAPPPAAAGKLWAGSGKLTASFRLSNSKCFSASSDPIRNAHKCIVPKTATPR
jgi:hypothetical protein